MGDNELTHIGWAVKSISKAKKMFAAMGFLPVGEEIDDVSREVRIAFVENKAGVSIELIEPLSGNSPIRIVLEKNGPTPYHVCFTETGSWENVKDRYERAGFIVAVPPAVAPALDGREVVFLYSRAVGLIELVFAGK